MGSAVLGELLILFLLVLNCSRMFFLKYGKVDSLTILSPVCVFLSLLQIISWNVDFFSILLLVISIFSFFTNFRALLRFCSGLYVDHYSIAFKIGAFVILLASLAEMALLVWFYPKEIRPEAYDVSVEKVRLSGSFTSGFEKAPFFSKGSGTIYRYSPKNLKKTKPEAIVLLSDKRADSRSYLPYMIFLAKSGYRVYTGDFYSSDLRWLHSFADSKIFRRLAMLFEYKKNPIQFNAQKEFYAWNMSKEMDSLLKFAREDIRRSFENNAELENPAAPEEEEQSLSQNSNLADEEKTVDKPAGLLETKGGNPEYKILIVGDWMADVALDDFIKEKNEDIFGILKLSQLPEFTSAGFGFIRHAYPLDAFLLGYEKASDFSEIQAVTEKTIKMLPEHPELDELEDESTVETLQENFPEEAGADGQTESQQAAQTVGEAKTAGENVEEVKK